MGIRAVFRYLLLGAMACLVVSCLWASEHHGLVRFGTVPVPGATVTATKGDKKVVAITDEAGMYVFPDLEDGIWKIQVDMLTFEPVSKEIGIAPGVPPAEWELKMQSLDAIKATAVAAPPPPPPTAAAPATAAAPGTAPGNATPSIVAANAAANANAANTPSGKTANTASGKNAKNGKKPAAAANTNPTVGFQKTDVNASGDTAAPTGAASAAPPVDATSTADAFVVNGSTSNGIERRAIGNGRKGPRSLFNGGIDFRGFRNDYLDARSYDLQGRDTARSPYTDYTIGGSVQGPLWAPHVFRWTGNFGVTFQTTRSRNANNQQFTMPTAAERAGNFAGLTNGLGGPLIINDPTTGTPIPNFQIPQNEISQQAKYLMQFYPMPQFAAPGVNFNYEIPIVNHSVNDQFSARVFKPINNKNTLNFTFVYQANFSSNNSVFVAPPAITPSGQFLDTNHVKNYRGGVRYSHNFTRSVFGNFGIDFTRSNQRALPFFAGGTDVSGQAGISGTSRDPLDFGPPGLNFSTSGVSSLSDGTSRNIRYQTVAGSAAFNYYRRPHSFQFGGDFRIQNFDTVGQSNPRGGFTFTGDATGQTGCVSSTTNACPGFDFADFLFGVPDTSRIAFGNADKYLRQYVYDAFINDDWKVSSNFTFQWGVRWDYYSPISEEYGRLVNLDIAPGFVNAAPVVGNNPVGPLSGYHYPSSLINPDRHQVSPRVSIAWRPIFGSSMVVRGGYGIYYNTGSVYSSLAGSMTQQYPLSKSLTSSNGPASPLTLANGFIGTPGVSLDTFGVDPNYRDSYTHMWNVSVQQNLTPSLLVTASYAGVKGTRLPQEFDPNTYAYNGPNGANPCPSCLLGYSYVTTNGNSISHAGSITARRRFHAGVSTILTYKYAKAIDDAGGLGGATGGLAQNWRDLAAERALSSTDQRHQFTASMQYSTGVGVHGGALLSGWRGLIFKGWTFTSNINVGSGLPFTPLYAFQLPVVGASVLRPNFAGGDPYKAVAGRDLNPDAFAAPALGQFGNLGRDTLTGPHQFNWDGSMQRSFLEKLSFTFNATNILNHPIVTSWYSTFNPNLLNAGQFGFPLNVGNMRTLNATFRWTF